MASFSLFFSCCIALIAFSSSVFGFSPSEYSVTCKSYSWWVLFPLNASIVDQWVPDQFPFIPKSSLVSEYSSAYSNLPSDKRMVTLEFNKQTDCYTQALKFIKTTFTEFKVQVPFLNAANFNNAAPLMYKPVIYADNLINVAGAIAQYGLNTVYASPMKYDVNNNFYSVDYWHRFIKGKFTPKSDWMPWSSVSQSSFAYQYYPMHQNTEWIGRVDGDKTKCAKHYYLWNDTKIRFVNADITFDKNLVLGNNPAFPINVNGDDLQKLATAFQIETTHHISGLEDCSTR